MKITNIMTAKDFLSYNDTENDISILDGEIIFHKQKYCIKLNKVKTHNDISAWVHHLSGKKWMTLDLISKFIELVSNHNNINIYKKKNKINPERAKMSQSIRYSILKRDGYRCSICGRNILDNIKLHVDHILPISRGGKTVIDNLRTLCDECNIGKSNSLDSESTK